MCGIFGAVGRNFDPHIVRHLATLNKDRGSSSTGFFNSEGRVVKDSQSSTSFLMDEEPTKFINRAAEKSWALIGHTRAPTRGAVNKKNAHPFSYGDIVGVHNGVIDAPAEYDVDSMYIFDQLSKHNPEEYQEALKDVGGTYVVAWFDDRTGNICILNWQGTIHFCPVNKSLLYISSDQSHLRTALGCPYGQIKSLDKGEVIRFQPDGKCKKLDKFKGSYRVWNNNNQHNTHHRHGRGMLFGTPGDHASDDFRDYRYPAPTNYVKATYVEPVPGHVDHMWHYEMSQCAGAPNYGYSRWWVQFKDQNEAERKLSWNLTGRKLGESVWVRDETLERLFAADQVIIAKEMKSKEKKPDSENVVVPQGDNTQTPSQVKAELAERSEAEQEALEKEMAMAREFDLNAEIQTMIKLRKKELIEEGRHTEESARQILFDEGWIDKDGKPCFNDQDMIAID